MYRALYEAGKQQSRMKPEMIFDEEAHYNFRDGGNGMNEKRKDELGRRFLLSPYILIDECNELEIQELIFLIHSSKHLKTKRQLQRSSWMRESVC